MTMLFDSLAKLSRIGRLILAASIAVAIPGIALCQGETDAGSGEDEEVRRYTVELLVFEYAQSAASSNEIFVPDARPGDGERIRSRPRFYGDPGSDAPVDESGAIDDAQTEREDSLAFPLEEEQQEKTVEEIPSHIIQTRLEVLDPEEHAMKDIYEKLVQLDAYRPIMRAAWTQATHEEDQTLPIRIRRLGNAPLRLNGTVKLYLSRYLHFVVDLAIEAEERQEQTGRRMYGDSRYYGDRDSRFDYRFGYEQEMVPIKYRISEDRIFRNGELRYYDHPKFGVLARVTRVEEQELETDERFLLPGNRQAN